MATLKGLLVSGGPEAMDTMFQPLTQAEPNMGPEFPFPEASQGARLDLFMARTAVFYMIALSKEQYLIRDHLSPSSSILIPVNPQCRRIIAFISHLQYHLAVLIVIPLGYPSLSRVPTRTTCVNF